MLIMRGGQARGTVCDAGHPRLVLSRLLHGRTCRLAPTAESTLRRTAYGTTRTASTFVGRGCHPSRCALVSCGASGVWVVGGQVGGWGGATGQGLAAGGGGACAAASARLIFNALWRWAAVHVQAWPLGAGRWSLGCGGRSRSAHGRRTSCSGGGCSSASRGSSGASLRPPRPTARACLPPSLLDMAAAKCSRPGQGGLRAAAGVWIATGSCQKDAQRRAGSCIGRPGWQAGLKSSCASPAVPCTRIGCQQTWRTSWPSCCWRATRRARRPATYCPCPPRALASPSRPCGSAGITRRASRAQPWSPQACGGLSADPAAVAASLQSIQAFVGDAGSLLEGLRRLAGSAARDAASGLGGSTSSRGRLLSAAAAAAVSYRAEDDVLVPLHGDALGAMLVRRWAACSRTGPALPQLNGGWHALHAARRASSLPHARSGPAEAPPAPAHRTPPPPPPPPQPPPAPRLQPPGFCPPPTLACPPTCCPRCCRTPACSRTTHPPATRVRRVLSRRTAAHDLPHLPSARAAPAPAPAAQAPAACAAAAAAALCATAARPVAAHTGWSTAPSVCACRRSRPRQRRRGLACLDATLTSPDGP